MNHGGFLFTGKFWLHPKKKIFGFLHKKKTVEILIL